MSRGHSPGLGVGRRFAELVGDRPDGRFNDLAIDYIRLAEQINRVPPDQRLPHQPRETP